MKASASELQIVFDDGNAFATCLQAPFRLDDLEQWNGWFSTTEQQRFDLYQRAADRELFSARRGLARLNIAKANGISPESIQLLESPSGKLSWKVRYLSSSTKSDLTATNLSGSTMDFSLSRSLNIVVAATSITHRIGIDVETIQELPELSLLARQNLHPIELAFWQSLPSDQQTKAYYQLWVVKEAFAKALGVGLSIPTDRFLTVDAMKQKPDGKIEYWLNRDTSIIGRFQQKDISANQVCAMVMVVSDNPSFVEIGVT